MADEIRDVVIKVRIEQGETKFDTKSAAKKIADDVRKQTKNDAADQTKLAREAAREAEKLAKDEQRRIRETQKMRQEERKAIREAQREQAAMEKAERQAIAEAQKEQQQIEAQERADARKDFIMEQRQEHMRDQAIRSLANIGKGATQMVRGIALAFVDADDESNEFIKTIVGIQSAFDTFTGAIDMISGMMGALDGMKKMSVMAGTAQKGLAASNLAVAGTAGTARAAMQAFRASLGPEMMAIAAIATLIQMMMKAGETSSELSKGRRDERDKRMDAIEQAERRGGQAQARSRSGKQVGIFQARIDAALAMTDVADQGDKKRLTESAIEASKEKRSILEARKANEDLNRAKGFAMGELYDKRAIGTRSEIIQSLQQEIQLIQRRTTVEKERLDTQREELDYAKEMAKEAKNKLDTEKEYQKSIAAHFGQLSQGKVNRLDRISKKLESGGALTKTEAKFLGEHGNEAGQKLAREFFAGSIKGERGLGIDDRLRALAGMGGLSAKDRLESARVGVEGADELITQSQVNFTNLKRAFDEYSKANQKQIMALTESIQTAKVEIATITDGMLKYGAR